MTKEEIAVQAMAGILSNSKVIEAYKGAVSMCEAVVSDSISYANEMIRQLSLENNNDANRPITKSDGNQKGDDHFSDSIEIMINNRKWYRSTGFNKQREENRKLKKGDAIIFKNKNWDDNQYGFMIINSFDFNSDFAARAYIGDSVYLLNNKLSKSIASDIAPGFDEFSFATESEIIEFFDRAKSSRYTKNTYLDRNLEYFPEYMKQYEKFFV